jgi:hypothetical protein
MGRYALGIAAGPSPAEDDPYRVARSWVASDEEFAEYATHIRLWQKALTRSRAGAHAHHPKAWCDSGLRLWDLFARPTEEPHTGRSGRAERPNPLKAIRYPPGRETLSEAPRPKLIEPRSPQLGHCRRV